MAKVLQSILTVIKVVVALGSAAYIASMAYILNFSTKANIPEHADAILVLGAKVI